MGSAHTRGTAPDGWPVEETVFLTLDLECDYGTALATNTYDAADRTAELVHVLEETGVPLTCFLQTEVLDKAPDAVARLEEASVPVEFHAHSHTHPQRADADVNFEVAESVERVRDQFGTHPVGYRFPDGEIRPTDYSLLADHDVPFSASVFPSFRPGRFNNVDHPLHPTVHPTTGVIELPFTVYSRYVRVPVALSYLKLIGRPYEWLVARRPPTTIVFDLHMHDIVVPPVYASLSPRYRTVYARNKREGAAILKDFILALRDHGHGFGTMTDLYAAVQHAME